VAEDNSTPLHKACAGSKPGHLAAVKLLLENGADVHALNKWRETPLLTAANHGQAGAVEALLKSGADPCKCTDTGWSPLSIAAYKGHDDVVRLLLDEGAPTEEEDPTLSALLQAATKGLPSTVELLLRHGADHTVTTKKGDTALSILVEQNLIDAAVEMVTDYSASIPRCSRDRKKIQRARLLINLRMKQLEKEGRKFNHNDDDESDDEDTSSNAAQNEEDDNNTNGKSKKKIKKGKEPKQSAEEKARVAEEALLRELEQEEQKQKQEEKEANSKRDKKRKKKEKERQQKMEEEEKRREQEEREAKERQRLRQVKEEQQKKEQELKLKEQREREMREAMEREKVLAAKRKDRERREREQAKLREKDTSGSPKASQDASSRPNKSPLPNKNGSVQSTVSKSSAEAKKGTGMSPRSALPPGRRWETKTAAPSIPRTAPTTAARVEGEPLSSVSLAPRNDNISPRGSPPEVGSFSQPGSPLPMNLNGSSTQYPAHYVEHPAIALFRLEKVTEMLQRCNPLANVVGEHTVKRVIYRWVVRAAHDSSPYIDPLIPSWRSFDSLATHFQRQFISESRRIGLSTHIETLREAGASVANLCVSLAKEVEQLERRVAGQLPVDWTDDALGMTISESIYNNESYVSLSWANRSSVKISAHRIRLLRERHVGLSSRFITSVFVTKIWYETLATIVNGTPLDIALSSTTQTILASEANVSAQLWSDPFTASEGNAFWGKLDAVDRMFGGREPFGREMSTSGHVLATHGGALSVFPPLDNMAASRYTQLMIDLLETASANNVPLSFLVFLPADCFPSHHSGPLINDLHLLDPRLGEPHRAFLQRVERLEPGRHVYRSLSSTEGQFVSPTSSLMIFLQNEAGKVRLPYSSTTMSRIVNSVLVAPSPEPSRMNNRIVSPMGFTGDFPTQALEAPLTPSRNYFEGLGPISVSNPQLPTSGDIDARAMGKPFSPGNNEVLNRPSRHGRLFDLVDDIEEDQSNEVDVVSGILNNLDMGLFQGSNLGSDVDIEAISLMGIGGGKSTTAQLGNHGSNFSTHFR
jgi:ankyrin repeat protein